MITDFKALTIPEGEVVKIEDSQGRVLWQKNVMQFYDYLETDGNSWIDTGMQGVMNYTYEISYQRTVVEQKRVWGVMGQTSWQGLNMSITFSGSYDILRWDSVSGGTEFVFLKQTNTAKSTIRIEDGSTTVNGNSVGTSAGHNSSTVISYTIFLGTVNGANTRPTSISKVKFYSYKVWDSLGTLLMDLRPTIYQGEAGMWDVVSNQFYGNANSSGTLTVGNDA